ncbi:MAG: hypothetical protein LCH30_07250 [Proteobacteria bacterium]|nr:hypothetical protein [Pseudomonadota bacterium]
MLSKIKGIVLNDKERLINKYIKRINSNLLNAPNTALEAALELEKLNNPENQNSKTLQGWFLENWDNLTDLIRSLRKRLDIKDGLSLTELVIQKIDTPQILTTIYDKLNLDGSSKNTFIKIISELFHIKEEDVHDLSASNNAVVHVSLNPQAERYSDFNDAIIVRIVRIDALENSPLSARKLLWGLKGISFPLFCKEIGDDGLEKTFLEIGSFYPRGDLDTHFTKLREHKSEKLRYNSIGDELLKYSAQLIQLMIKCNKRGIKLTDLKSKNILLDNNGGLQISDPKGFLRSDSSQFLSNKVNSTQDYYSDDVFLKEDKTHKHYIKLNLLQCQTLAATLYELIVGERAEKVNGKLMFDFTSPFFATRTGAFIQEFISDLYKCNSSSKNNITNLNLFLKRLAAYNPKLIVDEIDEAEEDKFRVSSRRNLNYSSSSSNSSPTSSPRSYPSSSSLTSNYPPRQFSPRSNSPGTQELKQKLSSRRMIASTLAQSHSSSSSSPTTTPPPSPNQSPIIPSKKSISPILKG